MAESKEFFYNLDKAEQLRCERANQLFNNVVATLERVDRKIDDLHGLLRVIINKTNFADQVHIGAHFGTAPDVTALSYRNMHITLEIGGRQYQLWLAREDDVFKLCYYKVPAAKYSQVPH